METETWVHAHLQLVIRSVWINFIVRPHWAARPIVFFVFAPPGWAYLWKVQTETKMHITMSSRESVEKARRKPAPSLRRPSTARRKGKARRGTYCTSMLIPSVSTSSCRYFTSEQPDGCDSAACSGGCSVFIFLTSPRGVMKRRGAWWGACGTLEQSRCLSLFLSLFSSRWLWINLTNCKYESGMFSNISVLK